MNNLITPHCVGWADIRDKHIKNRRKKVVGFGLVIGMSLFLLIIKVI